MKKNKTRYRAGFVRKIRTRPDQNVPSPGFEPGTTVPKTGVISISPQGRFKSLKSLLSERCRRSLLLAFGATTGNRTQILGATNQCPTTERWPPCMPIVRANHPEKVPHGRGYGNIRVSADFISVSAKAGSRPKVPKIGKKSGRFRRRLSFREDTRSENEKKPERSLRLGPVKGIRTDVRN